MFEEFILLGAEYLLVLLIGCAAVLIFLRFSELLIKDQLQAFDTFVYTWIFSYASDAMTLFMKGITFLGNTKTMIVFSLVILFFFLFVKPHRWYSITIPVVAMGGISLNMVLKQLFERPRPLVDYHLVEASGLSFPSGHAMFSFTFYGLMIYIIWHYTENKPIRYGLSVLLLSLAMLIGISRIYLGVHYPSDVFAGFAAGFIWLSTSLIVLRRIEHYMSKREHDKGMQTAATQTNYAGDEKSIKD